jgi:FtsZ-interacting cell division protein ZipA
MIPKLSGVAAVPPTLVPAGQRMGGERLAGEREVGWGTGGEHTGGERASSERIGGGRASSGGRAEAAGERVAHGAAADESIRAERRTIERGAGGADERRFMERDGERATFDEHDEPTTRFDASESDTDAEPVSASAARVTSAPGATSASASPLATDPLQPVEPIVEWPEEDTRKIIALRLVSGIGERFPGRAVRLALAAEGFVLGKFDIFHKPGPDARAMLSAASLTKPGTFSLSTMDAQRFGGLSLFAVLPGPLSPLATFDELLTTARALNDRLRGALQDERGEPLTPMRSASIRESLGAAASASAPVVGAAAAPPVVGGSDTPSPP